MISQSVNRPQDKPFKVLWVGETKPNETCYQGTAVHTPDLR